MTVRSADDAGMLACTASAWQGDPTRCRWCNVTLTGRRKRWCSDGCGKQFGRNHWWSWASKAAKERDGWACTLCGEKGRRVRGPILETDHIVPILGRHAETGCHHHLDGLRTLCRPCHLEVTAVQFATTLRRPEGQEAQSDG